MRKTIVISAVNLNNGGTLTILKDCLSYLSKLASNGDFRIVAIVYDKELAYYSNIEYIENKWPKKRWVNRLWYEYVSMHKISKELMSVDLWFSLHDTTPNVIAKKRAVYCHNSFTFYKAKLKELFYTPKIVLFSWFTKYIYKVNQSKNDFIVVQQSWFKQAMISMFDIEPSKIIIAPPEAPQITISSSQEISPEYSFLYPASPNSHKNFEVICRATEILERNNISNFKVFITVAGDENKYAEWLYKNWGHLKNLKFIGFLNRDELFRYYSSTQCLLFPSKVETWGLPISEFSIFDRPMLLANLPYTFETASGAEKVAYFDPDSAVELADLMRPLINADESALNRQREMVYADPKADNWEELFKLLLKES